MMLLAPDSLVSRAAVRAAMMVAVGLRGAGPGRDSGAARSSSGRGGIGDLPWRGRVGQGRAASLRAGFGTRYSVLSTEHSVAARLQRAVAVRRLNASGLRGIMPDDQA